MDISKELGRIASEIQGQSRVAKITEWTKLLGRAKYEYVSKLKPLLEHTLDALYQKSTGTRDTLVDRHVYVQVQPDASLTIEGSWGIDSSVSLILYFKRQSQDLTARGHVGDYTIRPVSFNLSKESMASIARDLADAII